MVKITGWTQAEIDATPADTLDWLLRIHRVEGEVRQEAERKPR